jgi:hypothetical protein
MHNIQRYCEGESTTIIYIEYNAVVFASCGSSSTHLIQQNIPYSTVYSDKNLTLITNKIPFFFWIMWGHKNKKLSSPARLKS